MATSKESAETRRKGKSTREPPGSREAQGVAEPPAPASSRKRPEAKEDGASTAAHRRTAREARENAIQASRRARDRAEPRAAPPEGARARPAPGGDAPAGKVGKPESDPWTVPQSVRDRFTQEGHRFYFPDGTLAFKDRGRKLITDSENTQVIYSLVEIAKARGWEEITVQGTERFRQEAWRQGRLAGLAVRGYKPSELERAQLARAIANRAEGAREILDTDPTGQGTADLFVAEGARGNAPPGRSGERPPRTERIVGKLLDHGRDTYRFDPHAEMSYFVRIETPRGKREIWGKDLQRAMEQSLTQPQIGDEIGLVRTGQDAVTVKRRERDREGRLLSEKDLATHRNRWVIEKLEFFERRAAVADVVRNPSVDARRAVRAHPELAGTYLQLRAAELAARTFRDPEDQKKFVAIVRGALADAIERGDPLQPVRLRERSGAERTKTAEREQVHVRG